MDEGAALGTGERATEGVVVADRAARRDTLAGRERDVHRGLRASRTLEVEAGSARSARLSGIDIATPHHATAHSPAM